MKHEFHDCNDEDCSICKGGLALCIICGLGEGELTTDCPGERVEDENIRDRVYRKGTLDFRNGEWVNSPNPTNQTWARIKENKGRKK